MPRVRRSPDGMNDRAGNEKGARRRPGRNGGVFVSRYFLPRAELRPVPRPSPIFLANSDRCSAYFGATIG